MVHYIFQHMSTITKLSQIVTQYYKNITSPIGTNTRIQREIQYEQYNRCSRVSKEKLERWAKGPRRTESQTVCRWSTLQLRISDQQLGESRSSKLWDLDMRIQGSQKLPNEWCGEGQVAYRDKYTCIDKSNQKNMYWKLCREHMHTGVDREIVSDFK